MLPQHSEQEIPTSGDISIAQHQHHVSYFFHEKALSFLTQKSGTAFLETSPRCVFPHFG
jgi:ABC-type arginine transport system ATPase subunit